MDQTFKLADGYRNWTAFVNKFRRIEESLQESKKIERVLVQRCNLLKSELVKSGDKLHTVMQLRTEDERTMALLRKECDRSVVSSMEAKRKEKEAQLLISGLQADIEALQAQVGVLQSALWLERERANRVVESNKHNNAADAIAAKKIKNCFKTPAVATSTPTPAPATAPAAPAAAPAGPASARPGKSSTAGLRGFASGGFSGKQRVWGRDSRPATTPAAALRTTSRVQEKFRGKFRGGRLGVDGGDGGGGYYRYNDNKNSGGDYCRGWGNKTPDKNENRSAQQASLSPCGNDAWTYRGKRRGSCHHEEEQEEVGEETFTLDLDGQRRRYVGVSGGAGLGEGVEPAEEAAGTMATPFQRWKREKGIFSPGVAEMFRNYQAG